MALAYLGETDIWAIIAEAMVPEAAQVIRELSKSEVLAAEQYIDMMSGRTFRQTLLVHEASISAIDRSLDPARNRRSPLRGGARIQIRLNLELPGEYAFDDGTGTAISTSDSTVQQSINRFIARLPSLSSSLIDLAPPGRMDAEEERK